MMPALRVEGLRKIFPVTTGIFKRKVADLIAADNVTFSVNRNEAFGIAGESGSGKTTVLRSIARLIEPTAGRVSVSVPQHPDAADGGVIDVTALDGPGLKRLRRHMQMIFQDPNTSLNDRMTVEGIIREPFEIHRMHSTRERSQRVVELLSQVGLNDGFRNRYPHELSGGQRQRIGIARALALEPSIVLADEPVSALDMSVQSQVLNLFERLRSELGLTLVIVAHDLAVLSHLCDRIAIMYLGEVVELAATRELFAEPLHPYTEALLASLPLPDPQLQRGAVLLRGSIPSPIHKPLGCSFHTRCRYAKSRCENVPPSLAEHRGDRLVTCHFAAELSLQAAPEIDLKTMGLV
jgi:oligopeptide/dipeptide ABC transporter ATP-binding protein